MTSDSTPESQFTLTKALRQRLLYILAAIRYVEHYALNQEHINDDPKKPMLRGIKNLEEGIVEYNKDGSVEKKSGSSSYIVNYLRTPNEKPEKSEEAAKFVAIQASYNQINDTNHADVVEKVLKIVGINTAPDTDDTFTRIQKNNAHLEKLNFCENLIETKFGYINPYKLTLKVDSATHTLDFVSTYDSNGLSSKTDAIKAFVSHSPALRLGTCKVDFEGPPQRPTAAWLASKGEKQKRPANKRQTGMQTQPHSTYPSSDRREYCLAHYLNLSNLSGLAIALVELGWAGDALVEVTVEQLEGYVRGRPAYTFKCQPAHGLGGIIDCDKIQYVVLQTVRPKPDDQTGEYQMQISIPTVAVGRQRGGVYSTINFAKDHQAESTSARSSGVVLQTVGQATTFEAIKNLGLWLAGQLEAEKNATSPPATHSPIAEAPTYLTEAHQIRYRLLGQMVSLRTKPAPATDTHAPATTTTSSLKRFVGQYQCFYLRMSKDPVRFETSYIIVSPDGTVQLQQPQDDGYTKLEGRARLRDDRLWIFLNHSHDDVFGSEPVRFILETADTKEVNQLHGIFSSETKQGRWLVAGRMLMKRINSFTDFMKVERQVDELIPSDFDAVTDLPFFTAEKPASLIRTDGPLWARVNNRILLYSAYELLADLCASPNGQNRDFSQNQFYYYTYKPDSESEKTFVIERDLVTIHSDGNVQIDSRNATYRGYAYHRRDTLRFSLVDDKNDGGFLEVFLEFKADNQQLHEIKYLYGMSLYHSRHRIQGKLIVLSRFAPYPYSDVPTFFRFLDGDDPNFTNERTKLFEEDEQSGGVIGYCRGRQNRYLNGPANASPNLIRSRDLHNRRLDFRLACYYGYELHKALAANITDEGRIDNLLSEIRRQLKESYSHGFASGSGMPPNLDVAKAARAKNYIRMTLKAGDKQQQLRGHTDELVDRIQEMAKEQIELLDEFGTGGALNHEAVREIARSYWPDLLPTPPPSALSTRS